jgi:hypothetical protein
LNALTMAYCQLIEVLVLRSLFSGMVWLRLKKLEVSQTIGPREMGDAAPSGSQPSAY